MSLDNDGSRWIAIVAVTLWGLTCVGCADDIEASRGDVGGLQDVSDRVDAADEVGHSGDASDGGDSVSDATGSDASQLDTGDEVPTWRGAVLPMLETKGCPGGYCHGGGRGGLDWGSAQATYDELVGVTSSEDGGCSDAKRVAPGDSANSHLFLKLKGTPLCGESMPPYPNPKLSQDELGVVRAWIDGGAPLE